MGGVKIIGVNLYAGIQFPNGKILSVGIESPSGPYYQHYGAITEDTDTIHLRIMERIVWPQDSHDFLYAFYSEIQEQRVTAFQIPDFTPLFNNPFQRPTGADALIMIQVMEYATSKHHSFSLCKANR